MRLRGRVDDNQREVVAALRDAGCNVQSLAAVGGGVPDLLVRSPFTGRLHLLEVKDGRKPAKRRALTPDEAAFATAWGCVEIVLNVAEALVAVGALKGAT